jgi:hypothetical protein
MASGRLARRLAGPVILAVLVSLTSLSCTGGGGGASSTATDSLSPGSSPSLSSLTPALFVTTLCGAEFAWKNATKIRAGKMAHDMRGSGTAASGQRILIDYFDGVISDTEDLILAAQSMGAPAVGNGAQVQAQLVAAFTKVRDAFSATEQKIKASPERNRAGVTQAAKTAGRQLKAAAADVGSTMAGLGSSELVAAFKSDASCSAIRKA